MPTPEPTADRANQQGSHARSIRQFDAVVAVTVSYVSRKKNSTTRAHRGVQPVDNRWAAPDQPPPDPIGFTHARRDANSSNPNES